jgi:hypothetical protein
MYKLQHRVKLPDGRLKYIICRHINITVQTIYLYALILSMSVIYNCKKNPFQRYLLHVDEYVLNVVEHGVYKYLFLNVKYYILKWMKICNSKLKTYISIFSMDNAWTSKPTCAYMTMEIPTSNKHRTSR